MALGSVGPKSAFPGHLRPPACVEWAWGLTRERVCLSGPWAAACVVLACLGRGVTVTVGPAVVLARARRALVPGV